MNQETFRGVGKVGTPEPSVTGVEVRRSTVIGVGLHCSTLNSCLFGLGTALSVGDVCRPKVAEYRYIKLEP